MATYKEVLPLKSIDAAYIAGLIDGDGTITLSNRHRNENRQLVVTISNNERKLLEYVADIAGVGTISKKKSYKENHHTNYTYKVSNRQAYHLLEKIIQFLKSHKKHRAAIVLDKYLELTPRNGKYSKKLEWERATFIKELFTIKPGYVD
jgi:intein/homing endonuclease